MSERAQIDVAEASRLRQHNATFWTYEILGKRYRCSGAAVYYALNPERRQEYRGRSYDKQRGELQAAADAKRAAHVSHVSHVKSNDREMRRQRALMLPDTRDFTAQFFGDPPPGRSALDQKRARDAR